MHPERLLTREGEFGCLDMAVNSKNKVLSKAIGKGRRQLVKI